MVRRGLRCRDCDGNVYLEAVEDAGKPRLFALRCMSCGMIAGTQKRLPPGTTVEAQMRSGLGPYAGYWPEHLLIEYGVTRRQLTLAAESGTAFLWLTDEESHDLYELIDRASRRSFA